MECQEITQATVALEIMQTPDDNRLQKLFHCIYSLFQGSFLNWIMSKYSNTGLKDKLWEDAKDAFQNGILALLQKAKNKELSIKSSLKTTIYSFGLLQLLAFFKKEKFTYGVSDYLNYLDLFFEDDFLENERQKFLNERVHDLAEAFKKLSKKQRDILYMKFFTNMTSNQIADILNVSKGNVDNEASKAYKALRSILVVF